MPNGIRALENVSRRIPEQMGPGLRRGWAIVGKRKLETEANNGGGDIELVDGGPTYPSVHLRSINFNVSLLVALARATKNTSASQDIQNVQNSWAEARERLTGANQGSLLCVGQRAW